jgi:hypothetical protein
VELIRVELRGFVSGLARVEMKGLVIEDLKVCWYEGRG